MKKWFILALLLLCGSAQAGSWSQIQAYSASSNANSPLGFNLAQVAYYNPSALAFTNLFVSANQWISTKVTGSYNSGSTSPAAGMTISSINTGESADINNIIDSNGNPTAVTYSTDTFNAISVLLADTLASPYYPPGALNSGTYDVTYTGTCNYIYSGDVTSVSRSAGHDMITVTPSGTGIYVTMTTTASGASQCINTGVTYSTFTSAYEAGNCLSANPSAVGCYTPAFLAYEAPMKTLRFKDWMVTDYATSVSSAWSTRPTYHTPFYGSDEVQANIPVGVPAELMFALLNYLNADGEFAIPAPATQTQNSFAYATGFGTLAASNLNAPLKVYLQYSNETWNGIFASKTQMQQYGYNNFNSADPSACPNNATFGCGRAWFGYATEGNCAAFVAAGFPSNRFTCGYGTQNGNSTGVVSTAFSCAAAVAASYVTHNCVFPGDNAVETGAYYSGASSDWPSPWANLSDGGLTAIFDNLFGTCGTSSYGTINDCMPSTGNTTSGGSTTITLSSGLSLASLVNGQCVGGVWGASPNNGATLNVDSLGAVNLTDNNGSTVSSSNSTGNGTTFVACYNSSPAQWRVLKNNTTGYSGGVLAEYESFVNSDATVTASDASTYCPTYCTAMVLSAYEGGPSLANPGQNANVQTMIDAANADSRMATATTDYLNNWRTAGGHNFNYFQDMYPNQYQGDFGAILTLCATSSCALAASPIPTSVKYAGLLTWILNNQKTWSFPYLLKRDFDPASNDNSPAFLNRAA
jgi:hypothetical protein